jgi:phosphate starvation-inducible protein PhoH and related proteins
LSKRKTGALRRKDPRFTNVETTREDTRTFYTKESKTVIDFNQAQQKQKSRKKVELLPKSVNQEKYILALTDYEQDIVVASGPAGTGKTYLAVLAAIQALRDGDCEKMVITRPAVAVDDEKHGFLPGDLNQKMEPWVKPLYDIITEFYSVNELQYMLAEQVIEIAPLGFCRGRTFKNSWIIVDESQNATPSQLKMLLTRIGEGSKIIITGDTEQTDRKSPENGLLDLTNRLKTCPVPGMVACEFDKRDIRRHKIIEHILNLYA